MHFQKDLTEYKQARRVSLKKLLLSNAVTGPKKTKSKCESRVSLFLGGDDLLEKKLTLLHSRHRVSVNSTRYASTNPHEPAFYEMSVVERPGGCGSSHVCYLQLVCRKSLSYGTDESTAKFSTFWRANFFLNTDIPVDRRNGKPTERRQALKAIEAGQVDMIMSTHALIQESVTLYHQRGSGDYWWTAPLLEFRTRAILREKDNLILYDELQHRFRGRTMLLAIWMCRLLIKYQRGVSRLSLLWVKHGNWHAVLSGLREKTSAPGLCHLSPLIRESTGSEKMCWKRN